VTPIAGVTIEATPRAVWVRSERGLRVVSSALVGGELGFTHHVVNMRVPAGYGSARPRDDLIAFARELGIRGPFVGLMTAAPTEAAARATEEADGITVTAIATVGLGTAVSAGLGGPAEWRPSTINTLVLLDARLEVAAAVNGVITATEAKVAALTEAGVKTAAGAPATGTVTDAVVVAWTGRGVALPYLGPAAPGGCLLARAVRRAIAEGIARDGHWLARQVPAEERSVVLPAIDPGRRGSLGEGRSSPPARE
jgi:adenosylcobinamide amidohydrolase